jgi:hypothetical protein
MVGCGDLLTIEERDPFAPAAPLAVTGTVG